MLAFKYLSKPAETHFWWDDLSAHTFFCFCQRISESQEKDDNVHIQAEDQLISVVDLSLIRLQSTKEEEYWLMMMGECRGGRDIDDECYKRPPKDHAIRRSFPSHKFKTRGKDCNTSIMATISYLWNSDRAHIDSRQIPMSNELPSDDLRRHTSSPETSKFSPELLLNPTFSSTMYQLNDSSRHSSNVQRGPSRRLLRRASSSFVWQDYSTNFLRFTVGDNQSESHHRGNNCLERVVGSLHRIYRTNEFVILIIVSIILAKAYPPLGAKHVYPRITSSWIVVVFIFCTSWPILEFPHALFATTLFPPAHICFSSNFR